MPVPRRPRDANFGTAAVVVAVPVLLWTVPASAAPPTTASNETPISLQVWRYHFQGEPAFLAELREGFRRVTGRKVELYDGEWSDCARRVNDWTGRSAEYAPDMLVVQDAQLPDVLGRAASLEGRFTPSFLASLYPGALAQGRVQGVLVALPWVPRPLALYYNADLLKEKGLAPHATPQQLVEVAQKLADPPRVYGFGLPGAPAGGAADCFMALFRAFGGLLFDDRGRLSLDSDAGRRTLDLFSGLMVSHATQPEVLTWSDAELAQAFLAGRVAMVIGEPWLLRAAGNAPPAFTVGVAPVPREKGGFQHLTTDCVIILDTARDIDACTQFLQYALGPGPQRALAACGVPPVRRDAAGGLPKGEGWEVYVQALREARGPSASTWGEIRPLLENLLYVTVSGRATPQEAIDAIAIDLLDDPEYVRLGLPPPRGGGKP
ncbi:MAG: extracellular solute-binding protein [Armatimonadetes bacterium]|nr:extracellular solute-binding protein [Armatimonadota bacterium]